ncbi:RecX family transcriptional regulator [Lihuaxuella thermophila]|uniref:Regulatory protein RecX n=1 Tax=Lihuaxuella thermophila TaxID=1173111 RepID=A0A1H8GIK6_9BACL|nr:RecX family transcriptional regulator [Lihuaxuella thermophila]SEN43793.1 regulatory protein [Lihuaxuella thermophila]
MKTNFITRIEKPSGAAKRYRIYVNEEYLFSVHEDVLVKYRLYKGMAVDQEQIRELLTAEEYNKVRLAALRYLSYRPRTCLEVKQYLAGKGYSEENAERVIHELEQQGFLDDREYAYVWVREKRNSKGHGPLRMRRELARKGIASKWIDEALAHTDEEEERQLAMEIAERRYLRICHEPWPKVERKLGQYLLRQGYSTEIACWVLNDFRSRHKQEKENL